MSLKARVAALEAEVRRLRGQSSAVTDERFELQHVCHQLAMGNRKPWDARNRRVLAERAAGVRAPDA